MKESVNRIQKVILEVNTSQVQTANYIKNNIDLFLRNELFPRLEKLFENCDLENSIIRLEELNIGLSIEKWDNSSQLKFNILTRMEEQLNQELKKNIKKVKYFPVNSELKNKDYRNISAAQNFEEIFLFFIQNGYFPWYGSEKHIQEFSIEKNWKNSFSNPVFIEKLKEITEQNHWNYIRLIYQFPIEMVFTFLSKINPRLQAVEERVLFFLKNFNSKKSVDFLHLLYIISVEKVFEKIITKVQQCFDQIADNLEDFNVKSSFVQAEFSQIILRSVPENLISEKEFQNILNESLFHISQKKMKEVANFEQYSMNDYSKSEVKVSKAGFFRKKLTSGSKEQKLFKTDSIEHETNKKISEFNFVENNLFKQEPFNYIFTKEIPEIVLSNTGLVLLHPYLKPFFNKIKCINEKGEFFHEKYDLAIQSLHYLATGKEEVFEGNLLFEKFLCGYPLKRPIQKQSVLTPKIKKEAEIMLKEVIKNWPALKRTSPDGLRQLFLQRNGKLIHKENKYLLVVERKAQDALLEKLNWNISIVKLPWITEMLYVEW